MINLRNPIGSFSGGEKYRSKPTGYFVVKILKSTTQNSKAGNPMWVIEADIVEGDYTGYFAKYPLRSYQGLNNDVGQQIVAEIVKRIVSSNEGMIDPNVVNASEFDESAFTGLLIGANIVIEERNDKKYCKIAGFCDVEYARKNANPSKGF